MDLEPTVRVMVLLRTYCCKVVTKVTKLKMVFWQ